jgi:hypothetical protein
VDDLASLRAGGVPLSVLTRHEDHAAAVEVAEPDVVIAVNRNPPRMGRPSAWRSLNRGTSLLPFRSSVNSTRLCCADTSGLHSGVRSRPAAVSFPPRCTGQRLVRAFAKTKLVVGNGSAGANGLRLLALSYFYDIAVWVPYVAAELKTVIFRFGEKLRSSVPPLLVTGSNVSNADVYKAADFIGICGRP